MHERASGTVAKRQICPVCDFDGCPGGPHPWIDGSEPEDFDDTDNEHARRERPRQFGLGRLR